MSMMKHMLQTVMDGIKDAEMLAGYAEEAKKYGVDEHVRDEKHDDEMVEALECHVNRSLDHLRERVEKL